MSEVALKSATTAQLKQFCDESGLDYSDIDASSPLGYRAKLLALVRASGLADDKLSVEGGDSGPKIARPEPKAAKAEPGEKLPEGAFRMLCDALAIDFVGLSAEDRPAAHARCLAHRDATRADPRNPFPGKAHGDKVRIMIQSQDPEHVPGGDQPVFLSVNERVANAKRGEWMEMSWEYAATLANARITLTRMDPTEGLQKVGEVASYPYNTAS